MSIRREHVDITNINIDRVFDVLQIRFDQVMARQKQLEQKMTDLEQKMATTERRLEDIAASLRRIHNHD